MIAGVALEGVLLFLANGGRHRTFPVLLLRAGADTTARMRHLAPLLLSAFALFACGSSTGTGGTTSNGGSAGTGGSGGSAITGGPIVWKALPAAGAPSARYLHSAVWSGDAM